MSRDSQNPCAHGAKIRSQTQEFLIQAEGRDQHASSSTSTCVCKSTSNYMAASISNVQEVMSMGPQQVHSGVHPRQSSEDDHSPYPSGSLGEGAGSRCERFGGKQSALRRRRQGVSVTRRLRTWRGHCAEGRDSVHVRVVVRSKTVNVVHGSVVEAKWRTLAGVQANGTWQ